jgi:hypothetical protein
LTVDHLATIAARIPAAFGRVDAPSGGPELSPIGGVWILVTIGEKNMKPAIFMLLPLLLPGAPDATPPGSPRDIIPDGWRHIKFVLSVDASAVSACLCRVYKIAPGDTIVEIAKRECGDARCADEIRLMNPEVKDDKLRPGDYLRIPPRASASESRATSRTTEVASGCFVLLTVQWGRGGGGTASVIVEGEPIDVLRRGKVRVVAVPREKLLWFLQLPLDGVFADRFMDGVMCSDVIVPTWLNPEADPAVTIEERVTLRKGKDQGIVFDVEQRRYDKSGKILAWKSEAGRLLVASLPVAAIGFVALLGVIGIARRRRARADG